MFMTPALRARLLRLTHSSSLPLILALTSHVGVLGAQGVGIVEINPSAAIDVVVRQGRLTIDVRNAPLAQVLRTIAERAGLALTLRSDLSAPITQSFTDLPLREGIERLVRGHSLALSYGAAGGGPGGEIVTGVWVMDGSSAPGAFAVARSAESTSELPSQGARDSRASEPSSLNDNKDEKAGAIAGGAAVESPGTRWIREIRTLTEEAVRGSEAAVADLGDIIASDADAAVRHQAVAALGQLKGPEIEEVLTDALADVDTSVRVRAVRGLRGAGTDTAVQSLTEVLAGDPDPQVRLAAVRALTSLPGTVTAQGLEKALSDPDAVVRETAARGLSWWVAHLAGGP